MTLNLVIPLIIVASVAIAVGFALLVYLRRARRM